jgi:hypothetical protein
MEQWNPIKILENALTKICNVNSVMYPFTIHVSKPLSYHSVHGIYRIHTGFYKKMNLTQLNTLKIQSETYLGTSIIKQAIALHH